MGSGYVRSSAHMVASALLGITQQDRRRGMSVCVCPLRTKKASASRGDFLRLTQDWDHSPPLPGLSTLQPAPDPEAFGEAKDSSHKGRPGQRNEAGVHWFFAKSEVRRLWAQRQHFR